MRKRLKENVQTANCFLRKFDFFQFSLFFISSNIYTSMFTFFISSNMNPTSMVTLRLEVGSFELELRQVDVAGDAPGLEGELLTAVNELGAGAGGFHLVVVDMVIGDMVIVNMVIGDMVIVNMVMVNIIIVIMVKLATMRNQKLPSLSPPWFT